MPTLSYRKPKLPSHYYVLFEPPDSKGDEVLHFISERRRIVIKGRFFREFQQYVIPLLDGRHTVEQIAEQTSDVFRLEDLVAGLQLLADQHLLQDAGDVWTVSDPAAVEPQLNFFHEVSDNPHQTQARISNATVAIFGLGGAGASVALGLAAARMGTLRCIDSMPVAAADPYLSSIFQTSDVGSARAAVIGRRIESTAAQVRVIAQAAPFDSDEQVALAIRGSDFVVCCLDQGQSSLIYKLNRACLQEGIRWISCSTSGMEVVVGPTVRPFETACYLCYKMRSVACAQNPEHDFAYQRMLDQRRRDDSGRRENLNFAPGIAANVLGLETLKEVSGLMAPATVGKILVIDLVELSMKKHVVLRKPWCPACFSRPEGVHAADSQSSGT